jgi:hypothetical protein
MALFLGTPKLESRNCPETVPVGVLGLWELIIPDCKVRSQRGLNQSCSPRWDLSNDVLHSQFGFREEVDSRFLVVESQTTSLTPGPSFAHNLGCRCPNDQYEAIFDIYAWRPFQWHQKHLNARCFGPYYRILNIRESRRTPSPQLWECWASPPHLAKVGLRQQRIKVLVQGESITSSSQMVGKAIFELMHRKDATCDLISRSPGQHDLLLPLVRSPQLPYLQGTRANTGAPYSELHPVKCNKLAECPLEFFISPQDLVQCSLWQH